VIFLTRYFGVENLDPGDWIKAAKIEYEGTTYCGGRRPQAEEEKTKHS